MYNRVENLDELIRSVKLPYLAWKVLFLVNKKANSKQISDLLEVGEDQISELLDQLVQNGLILEVQTDETDITETDEEITEEEIVPADHVIDEIPAEISEEIAEVDEETSVEDDTMVEAVSNEFEEPQEMEAEIVEAEEEYSSDPEMPEAERSSHR
jgi:DNA-binding MarR family transcriptional regulator